MVWPLSKPAPFWTRLAPFDLSNLELTDFLMRLGWIYFRSELVWTEIWDDGNATSEDDQKAYSNVEIN